MMNILKKSCCLLLSISMMVSTIAPTWAVKISHQEHFSPSSHLPSTTLKEYGEDKKTQEKLQEIPLNFQTLPKNTEFPYQTTKPTKVIFGESPNPVLAFMKFSYEHPLQALMFFFLMQNTFFKDSPLVKVPGAAADLSVSGLDQNLTWNGILGSPVIINPFVVSDPTIPEDIFDHYNVTFTLSDITAGNLTCNSTTSLQPSFSNGIWNLYSELIPLNDFSTKCNLVFIPVKNFSNLTIAGNVKNIETQQVVQGNIRISSSSISTQSGSITTIAGTPTPSTSTTRVQINTSSTSQSSEGVTTTPKGGTSINQSSNSPTNNLSLMMSSTSPLSNGLSTVNDSLGTSHLTSGMSLTNPITANSLMLIMNNSEDKSSMIIGASVAGCVVLSGVLIAILVGYKRQWCGLNSSAKQSQAGEKALESGNSKQYGSLGLYHNLPQSAGQSDRTNYSKPPAPDSIDQSQGAVYTKAPIAPAGSPQAPGLYTNAPIAPANSPVAGQNNYIACDATFGAADSAAVIPQQLSQYNRVSQVGGVYIECDEPLS